MAITIIGAANLLQEEVNPIPNTFGRDRQAGGEPTPAQGIFFDELSDEQLRVRFVGFNQWPTDEWNALKGTLEETYDAEKVVEVQMHESAFKEVGTSAFSSFWNLRSATVPEGLENINARAFFDTSLSEISLPNTLKIIGEYAFYNCGELTLTSLPDGITEIGEYAFHNCGELTLTSLPRGLTSIQESAFQSCSKLALTSLPSGLKSIGAQAFSSCANLALTSLPSGLKSIGAQAFNDTSIALTTLPSGLMTVDTNAFSSCANLALTSLPESLTTVGQRAFANCTSLALTSLPESLINVGINAFTGCTGLKNIEIAAQTLGIGTFINCTGLEKVWIRSACLTITAGTAKSAPFAGCSTSLAIYAEPASKLEGWGTYYNRTGSNGGTTVSVSFGQTTSPF